MNNTSGAIFDWGRIARLLLTGAIIAVFVQGGVYGIKMCRSRRTVGNGPLNSADSFLSDALHVRAPAEKILAALADLPAGRPLGVITHGDNIYGQMLPQTIGAFTWPRQISIVPVNNPDIRPILYKMRDQHYAAALVYDLTPPMLPSDSRHIGLLTIVPIAK